jgi:hypothetical protein
MTKNKSILLSIFLIIVIIAGTVLFYKEFSKIDYNQIIHTAEQGLEMNRQSDCKISSNLPDKNCTPGSVFANATAKEICVSGYAGKARDVSLEAKKQIYANYAIVFPQPTGTYELDHLIPLELGGDNSAANLWPESDSIPGFHEKDLVENYLHYEVCKGLMELKTAQQLISRDWISIYNSLPAE